MYGGLFTQAELDAEEQAGFVRIQEHPEDSELWIANYTQHAQFEGRWNNVTLNCRGLIFNAFGDLIARPMPKFFNYGEPRCAQIDLDEPAVVSDKMDGSLGIMYKFDGKPRIATRGSFTSEQAMHATEILSTKYASFKPLRGFTYLFEIIYPENRIVCDYGDQDDLVFLGAVVTDTGESYSAYFAEFLAWPGPVAEVFPYSTMREALEAKPRPGKEGFVVHLLDSDVRVKIKQTDYIELHRLVTGLNARSVWQAMVDDTLDQLIEQVPDEFHGFIRGVEQDICDDVYESLKIVDRAHSRILEEMHDAGEETKRDFAMRAKDHNYSWALFKLWDGVGVVDIYSELLRRAKPKHDYSPIKDVDVQE